MATQPLETLDTYLGMRYPFRVVADPEGGYVILFPDLPGCVTQVESLGEIPRMAHDVRVLWIETAYEEGLDIPLPSYPEEYSGRFNLRLPRSLHRSLAQGAENDGISLNQYVMSVLARGDAQTQIERRLDRLQSQVASLGQSLSDNTSQPPDPSQEVTPYLKLVEPTAA